MQEMHLKQPRFTYNACGLFTRNKERIKKIKKHEELAEELHKSITWKFENRKSTHIL